MKFRLPAITLLVTLLPLATTAAAEKPAATKMPPPFRRPELVAIAWANPNVKSDPHTAAQEGLTAWRPDQTAIGPDEIKQLKSELREFGSMGRVEDGALPPLHLVFCIDENARNSQQLTPSVLVGQRLIESRAIQNGSSPMHLALSVVSPSRQALTAWPGEIDVEVRVPIEEESVVRTIKQLSDRPVDIEPGVRLLWTTRLGADPSTKQIFPALGLLIDHETQPLTEYDFQTHLTDETTESFNSAQADGAHEFRISQPLNSKAAVDHVDISRVRYRTETYRKIPIFPERIPGPSTNPPR